MVKYAELKCNLNLDTEKYKATIKKCYSIMNTLQEAYPEYEIKMFLVGLRYLTRKEISKTIIHKYEELGEHLVGIKEYLDQLGIQDQKEMLNQSNYQNFINNFVNQLL